MLPEFVLFLAALDEALGALLQGLDEDGLGHLEGRGVGLPQLQVDVGEDVAHHGRVSVLRTKRKSEMLGMFLKRISQRTEGRADWGGGGGNIQFPRFEERKLGRTKEAGKCTVGVKITFFSRSRMC